MILNDYHIHTNFCDGKNSSEEMVWAGIEKGLKKMGFTCHSYIWFDDTYCIKKDKIEDYKNEIHSLAEKYREKIEIICGVEQDYYSEESTDGYDLVIGSVHFVKKNDKYYEVDASREDFINSVNTAYDGDFYGFCEDYFETVGNVYKKTKAHIIGHFDLVTKFNEGDCLFDTSHPRYVSAWKKAVDKLLKTPAIFEINTGAISRGYRTEAYPSNEILEYIRQGGGKVILTSDSHNTKSLCQSFDVYEKKALEMGFKLSEI